MAKTIGVAGSTGFVGYNTVKGLLGKGLNVRGLVRKGSSSKRITELERAGAEIVEVDYHRPESLAEAVRGCEVLYHFVGASAQSAEASTYEANTQITLKIARAARRAGVGSIVYNSGLGVNTHTTQSYFLSKLHAERIIRKSGLRYVIFRPSYIIGVGDEFSEYIAGNILAGRPIPIYGSGNYRIQPLLIEDAVAVYSACLEKEGVWMKTFDLVGEEKVRFVDYVRLFAQKLGREARFTQIDLESAIRDAMRQKSKRRVNPYLSVDELDVLISDFTSSPRRLKEAFSIRITPLSEALEKIAKRIRTGFADS